MKTTHTSLVIAAGAAGLVAAAVPAQADRLPTDPNPIVHLAGTKDVGDADYCTFPVTIKIFSNQQVVKETTLPNGATEQRFTGHAEAIVTNDDTGKSITYNTSGPGTQTVFPDGSFTSTPLAPTSSGQPWRTASPPGCCSSRTPPAACGWPSMQQATRPATS